MKPKYYRCCSATWNENEINLVQYFETTKLKSQYLDRDFWIWLSLTLSVLKTFQQVFSLIWHSTLTSTEEGINMFTKKQIESGDDFSWRRVKIMLDYKDYIRRLLQYLINSVWQNVRVVCAEGIKILKNNTLA